MHDIEATRENIDLHLMAFIKSLYPTYSHYIELFQASDQLKSITFDKLVKKVADLEKPLERSQLLQLERLFTLLKKIRANHMIL
jgi:hypothetical protein